MAAKKNKTATNALEATADQLKHEFIDEAKKMLTKAQESGVIAEIDEALKDPEMQKSYQDFLTKTITNDREAIKNLMSIMFDIDVAYNSIENYDFPQALYDYKMLRRGGRSLPALLIKSYRYNQIIEFARVSDGKNPGVNITYLDRQKNLTKAEKKICSEVENYIVNSFFFVPNAETPSMSSFMFCAYNDIFDMDKVAIEVLRESASFNKKYNNRGKPVSMVIVDAGLVHQIVPKVERKDRQTYTNMLNFYQPLATRQAQENMGYRTYFQNEFRYGMIDRLFNLIALYTPERMLLKYFFTTTDIEQQFKGCSVVERSLDIMRYIMDSVTYNVTRRSSNTMPKGMIVVPGATEDGFSKEEMALFKKLIWGISAGKNDRWKYPVIGLPKGVDPKFIKFHESSREMEDFLWMSTLFSWMCTFEGLSPEVINMASNKNSVGKQKLFDKREEEGAMVRSQDPGLRRFLNNMADVLNNSGIFEEMTGIEGVGLVWSGLDVEDETKKLEIDTKRLQTTCSVNDLLVEADKPKQTLMAGDINIYDLPAVCNPQFLQLISNAILSQQQKEQQEQEQRFGGPGGQGGEGQDEEYNEYPNWDETDDGDEDQGFAKLTRKVNKSVTGGKNVTLTVEIDK